MGDRHRTAAIVGCGDIAHHHVKGYQLAGVDVVAFVDPLPAAHCQFLAEYGSGKGYCSLQEMFTEVTPDLISVCTWHLLHAPLTIEAAAVGVEGIICEKPMAVGMAAVDRMIAACEASGTKLAVSHQRRFTPGWEKGRELIASGALGGVVMVVAKIGSGLLNCGTHAIDGVRFLLGDPATEWVMGAVERRTDKFERDTPIADSCMGLVHFHGGVQLFLQCDLDMAGASFEFFVRGTKGMMEVSEVACRTMGGSSGQWVDYDLGVLPDEIDVIGGKANARQTSELIEWICGARGHRCAAITARDTVEIMMALEESARRHHVVHMPLEERGHPLRLMIEEKRLPVEVEGRYDIRAFLKREDVDEQQYAELRGTGMSHHAIMRTLWERGQKEDPIHLLIFVGSEGIYHDHEGHGRFLTKLLNKDSQILAEVSQDYDVMASGLRAYDSILFFTDVGLFSPAQEEGLLDFVEKGGGFFGFHTADASFRDNAGYHEMLNGFFDGHSPYMDFTVSVADNTDPIVAGMEDFVVTDELHYLKHDSSRSHPVLTAYYPDRKETHVVAYRHTYGEGRVFFFALGHDQAVLNNPSFQEVVRRGVLWVGKHLISNATIRK